MSFPLWRLDAVETPRVLRPCPHCHAMRPFASSDRFRVNAQKRRLDAWLVYRCTDCDATWNREVFARVTPEEIGAPRLEQLHANDVGAAWTAAFLACVGLVPSVRFRVARDSVDPTGPIEIRIHMQYPCGVRLDRLIASELGVSRARLEQAEITTRPLVTRPLRKMVHEGQEVRIASLAL